MQWILISLLLLLQLPSWAEPSYDKLRDLMIEANTDTVIELIEKDFRKRNGKLKPIKIPEESASLYAIALIVNGELDKFESFYQQTQKQYPNNQDLKNINKDLILYKRFMQIPLQVNWKEFLDSNSLAHLEIIDALAAGKVSLDLKEKILQLRPQAYLPLPLDYFLDLGLYSEAEKQAIQTINAKSQILFPTGFDYYELSRAYRALASSAWQASKKNEAQKFLLLAKDAQSKIRSIWIEEDLILNHDFLKTTERYSKFGFLIPQWIMAMQNL